MNYPYIFSTFSILISLGYATKMPNFIPTCKLNERNLNECALKNAQLSIPGIVKGSRAYGIPNMIPLHIPQIDIEAGAQLKVRLTNNEVSGLEDTLVTAIDLDLKKNHMQFKVSIPRANIVGHYKINGHILILPIQGEGPANITFINGDFIYNMDYTFDTRNAKEYLKITNHNITFVTKRAYYDFQNLFNGDSNLGEEMNKFVNENWEEVTKDLGATVSETISSIITSIAMALFTKVPFSEVLTD